MDRKKNKLPEDDQLFRQAMTDVKPLKSPARTDSPVPRLSTGKRKPEVSRPTSAQDLEIFVENRSGVGSDDGTSHRKNGVQKKIMQKLKRGRFQVSAQLDLHQMTTVTGSRAMLEFIADSQTGSPVCIRIIHGKGLRSKQGPRLKLMARQLLRDHPQVMAYTACKPRDGGDGATDVLLTALDHD